MAGFSEDLSSMGSQAPRRHGRARTSAAEPSAFDVRYCAGTHATSGFPGEVLATFDFGIGAATDAPRHVQVPLPALGSRAPREVWTVAAAVATGHDGPLRWSAGGGWRCVVVETEDYSGAGGIGAASERAYRRLLAHIGASPEHHVLRLWNYLGAINEGDGDAERYRLFCSGRARGLAAHGVSHYPAATAIGHQGRPSLLQVYALCARRPGRALENPRQVSAWNYPRQYGPTAPSFARAMRMPSGTLAISGTAAVVGHASRHHHDVAAQADAAFANLAALLGEAGLAGFDAHSPLKIYLRHPADAAIVEAALARHLDAAVPHLLLHGDICRRELLVEIDGWCSAGRQARVLTSRSGMAAPSH